MDIVELTEQEESFLVLQKLKGVDVAVCERFLERKDDQLRLYSYKNGKGEELFYRLIRNNILLDSYFNKSVALEQWQFSLCTRIGPVLLKNG